jgi:hypothetical protein
MAFTTRLLSDETGTAFAETLVALPVLGLILAGVLALNAAYGAKLEAKSRARRVAWLQADSGECPTRACNGGGCQAIESEMRARGLDALSSPRGGELSLSSFVGSVREFFLGRTTTGVGTARAPTPRLVGSGQTLQRGATTLLCNTTSRRTSSGESILDHACSTGLRLTEYAGEVCN